MKDTRKVQLNIFIPVHYRDRLRIIAATEILRNPDVIITGASIAAEIICKHLDGMNDGKENEIDETNI